MTYRWKYTGWESQAYIDDQGKVVGSIGRGAGGTWHAYATYAMRSLGEYVDQSAAQKAVERAVGPRTITAADIEAMRI